jgi:hypothetical protein
MECHQCGIEVNADMAICVNCGAELIEPEGGFPEEEPEPIMDAEVVEEEVAIVGCKKLLDFLDGCVLVSLQDG